MANNFGEGTLGAATRTNATITIPASAPTGSILLWIMDLETAVPDPPDAFKRLRNEDEASQVNDMWAWWERLGASQGGTTRTVTHANAWSQAVAVVVENVHATAIPRIGRPNQGNGTVATALQVKPIGNDGYIGYFVVSFDTQNVAGTPVPPTGTTPTFTEQYDTAANLYYADGTLATAGATGDKTNTVFATTKDWIAGMVIVEDDGATVDAPQRFYLPASGTAAASPTVSAEWNHNNAVRRPMSVTKGSTTLADTAYSPDGADDLTAGESMFVQFVSSETFAAQTILEQQVRLQIRVSETNAGNNLFLTWKLMACAADDNAVLATLVAQKISDISECGTALANRGDSAIVSEVTIAETFRLVLEVGLGGTPTGAGGVQGHNGTMRFGESSATDLVEDEVLTTDNNPWLELALELDQPVAAAAVKQRGLLLTGVGV